MSLTVGTMSMPAHAEDEIGGEMSGYAAGKSKKKKVVVLKKEKKEESVPTEKKVEATKEESKPIAPAPQVLAEGESKFYDPDEDATWLVKPNPVAFWGLFFGPPLIFLTFQVLGS